MSTSRDFRINVASLQAAIERDQQSDEVEDDAVEHVNICVAMLV